MAPSDDREVVAVDHPVFDHVGPWTENAYLALPAEALPSDGRVELVEGSLFVGPGISADRATVVSHIREALESALPEGLRVLGPVPLRLGPECVLMPDLVVARALLSAPAAVRVAPGPATEDGDPPVEGPAVEDGLPEIDDGDPAPDEPVTEVDGEAGPGRPGIDPGAAPGDTRPEVLDAADALMVVEVVGREHGITDRSFKPQLYARGRIPYSLLVDHDGPFAVADMIIGGRYHEYARAAEGEALRVEEPFPLEIDLAAVTGAGEPGTAPDRAGGIATGAAAEGRRAPIT